MNASTPLRQNVQAVRSDIARGLIAITRNGFALLGLTLIFGLTALLTQPDLRLAS